MSIGLEVGDHPPNGVSVYSTIEGPDRSRFGDDSGEKKCQNQKQKRAIWDNRSLKNADRKTLIIQVQVRRDWYTVQHRLRY